MSKLEDFCTIKDENCKILWIFVPEKIKCFKIGGILYHKKLKII